MPFVEKSADVQEHHETVLKSQGPGPLRDIDVAAQFLANLNPQIRDRPIGSKEARKVLWKLDLILLPLLAVSVTLSSVDKAALSNAALYGLKTDTHLSGSQFSWTGSIFYIGYLVFAFPLSYAIQRFPIGKVFALTTLGWALTALCTAATHNFAGLAALRFFMGALESIVFPTGSIITVMWYKTSEQPLRNAIWFNTFATVFIGIISYGIGHAHTSIAEWRLLFLVLGGFSVLWAIILFVFLPDSPVTCWWLSDREKYICIQRVMDNNTGVEEKKFKWYQARECLQDPKAWLLVVFAAAQNIANGGLVVFAAFVVSGFGYTKLQTVLLGMPTGPLNSLAQVLLSYPAARIHGSRCIIAALYNMIPLTCAALLFKLPRNNHAGVLGAYYCFWTFFAVYVLVYSLPQANTSGHTKKITMNALMVFGYSVGNILGPQVFRAKDAPFYRHGFTGLMSCLAVASCAILSYGLLCWHENRKRDRQDTDPVRPEMLQAFSDRTDKEKPDFRYTF